MNEGPAFAASGLRARVLLRHEVPRVQALFDANPEYFRLVNDRCARPDEATVEFDERPPPHLPFRERWFFGVFDARDDLVGVLVVLADLGAPAVWHVALYLLATRLHGSGAALPLYAAFEDWAVRGGARWIRLGVVAANAQGLRFWAKCGFRVVRLREGIDTGGRINDVAVCVKPLAGGPIADYLALVPRDRPGSDLP
jgi:GNAT superfamily N-acetyltransferase